MRRPATAIGGRLSLCLFALVAAASTMGGVWSGVPAPDTAVASPIAVAVMCVLGAGFYLLLPASRIRHRKLVHLGRIDAGAAVSRRHRRRALDYRPDIVEEIRRLAGAAGVNLHSVWMNLDDPRGTALAFGRAGRRYLELRRGMVRRFDTDRAAFRCIVNHELGHLHHRDVDAIHLPAALFLGFAALVSVSFDFFPAMPHRDTEAGRAAQYFGFVLVAYLARNSILREREYHADAFAVARYEGGADEAVATLDRLLCRTPVTPPSLWERLIGVHPADSSRVAALWDRRRQPAAPPVDGLMLGMLVSATAAIGWPVLVALPLAGVVLASTVWRFTRTNLAAWGPRRGLSQLTLFVAALLAGLFAGVLTAPAGRATGSALSWMPAVVVAAVFGCVLVCLAWQRVFPGPPPQVRDRPVRPAQVVPAQAPPARVSAGALLGRLVVVLLAVAVAGLMVAASLAALRSQIAVDGVVDPFAALIAAALAFHLLSLGRAVVAPATATAGRHRALARQSLIAIGLLYVAGGVYFGRAPLGEVLQFAGLIGVALAGAGAVTSKAAEYLHQAVAAHRSAKRTTPAETAVVAVL